MSNPSPHPRALLRGRTVRLLAVAGAIALAAPLAASPAAADPGFSSIAEPATDHGQTGDTRLAAAAAYRESHPDLSPAAAHAAASAQASAEELRTALADHPEEFGGGWFDPYHATFHIAVTGPATAAAVTGAAGEAGVSVVTHRVTRSFAELSALAGELRAGTGPVARAADGQVGVDVRTNEVVAAVPAGELPGLAATALPDGFRLDPRVVTDVEDDACTSRSNCDDSLRSGLVLRREGTLWCSLGFTARNSAGTRIALTAGHCASVGETWSNGTTNQVDIGPVSATVNSGNADAARIVVTDPGYAADTAGRIAIGPSSFVPMTGPMPIILEDDVVCISASFTDPDRSGNPCATVTDVSDPNQLGLVQVTGYDACGGDSGGGWYWLPGSGNRYAMGLHKRSNSGCNLSGSDNQSWFSPITAFYTDLTYETS